MSSKPTSPPTVSPSEIVERVKACVESKGLQRTQEYFENMEHILSGLSWWGEVKSASESIFAQERKRLEELELARAKAAATNIFQILPTAQNGVKVDNPYFDGSMYEIKDNDNVNLGGNNNGQDKH
jgi:hypothetical protein